MIETFLLMKKTCGIYKITSPSGKIYIGESRNIEKRIYNYKINNCKKQIKLYNSIKKYSWESHTFEIIEECDFEDLLCRERFWQDEFDVLGENGLNCKLSSCNEFKQVVSEETKEKIGLANSGLNNGMYGKKISKAHLDIVKNYKHTKEALEKITNRSKGGNNPNAKLVLCTQTGIFYFCVKEAADTINMKNDTLKQQLNGRRKNKTSFIYV